MAVSRLRGYDECLFFSIIYNINPVCIMYHIYDTEIGYFVDKQLNLKQNF